jgi:FKBP-type peptidyl-prolyl cis-trans isomerase FklB
MKFIIAIAVSTVLLTGPSFALEKEIITDPKDQINYSLGYQIGTDIKQQGLDINPAAMEQGINDAQAGNAPVLGSEEMNDLLQSLKKNIVETQQTNLHQEQMKIKEQYRGEGREFLAKNAKAEGIVTLPSGLQYKIEKKGTGKSPGPHDTVKVHYRGTLLDGTEFDSSYRTKKPAEFRVDGVIAGWTEALQLMKEGAKWRIFVPADLAYGERGPLADRSVIFDIELIAVIPENGEKSSK